MSIAALYTRNGDINAQSLDELNNILSDKYDENNVLIKRLSRRINCKGSTGIAWFTPDAMLTRLNDHFTRLFEDQGVVSKEYQSTYRLYSDIALVVVPQISSSVQASISLSLVDSAMPLDALGENQTVTISSQDGPTLVLFHPVHSVPNSDRTKYGSNVAHRRLGMSWSIEHSGISSDPSTDITLFATSASWRRQFSLQPSFYLEQDPTTINIAVGYREHQALRNPRLVKQYVQAGLNIKAHLLSPQTHTGDYRLASEKGSNADIKKLTEAPKKKNTKGRLPFKTAAALPPNGSAGVGLPRGRDVNRPVVSTEAGDVEPPQRHRDTAANAGGRGAFVVSTESEPTRRNRRRRNSRRDESDGFSTDPGSDVSGGSVYDLDTSGRMNGNIHNSPIPPSFPILSN